MKYKVGDKVRIKSTDWYKQMLSIPNKLVWQNKLTNDFTGIWCGSHIFEESMFGFLGKIMTIQEVGIDFYLMEEDTCGYEFNDEMIEGLVEDESLTVPLKHPEDSALAMLFHKTLILPEGYQFVDDNGNVINASRIILEKKKPKYPQSYEECCEVLDVCSEETLQYGDLTLSNDYEFNLYTLLENFRKLRICRDAYWKIAGEEMGLGKPWDSKYGCGEWGYWLGYDINENKIYCQDSRILLNRFLLFPTAEMRDAFYENFKELIESCKELL